MRCEGSLQAVSKDLDCVTSFYLFWIFLCEVRWGAKGRWKKYHTISSSYFIFLYMHFDIFLYMHFESLVHTGI